MTEQAEGTVAAVVAATSVVNPYEIVFETKEACQGYIDRCVVRWGWAIGLVPYMTKKLVLEKGPTGGFIETEVEVEDYRPQARRVGGVVHDTQHTSFVTQQDDVKLDPYVIITKHGAKAFTIVNKY